MVEHHLLHNQPDEPRLLRLREGLPELGEPGQRRPDLARGDLRDREALLFGGEFLQPGLHRLDPAFGILKSGGNELGAPGAGGDGVYQAGRLLLVAAQLAFEPVALLADLWRALLGLGLSPGQDGLDQGFVGDELAQALEEESFEDRGAEAADGAGIGALLRDASTDVVEVLLLRAAECMIRAHRSIAGPAAHESLEHEFVLARAGAQVRPVGLGQELLGALEDLHIKNGGVLTIVELLVVPHLPDVGRIAEHSVELRLVEALPAVPLAGRGGPLLGPVALLVDDGDGAQQRALFEVDPEDVADDARLGLIDDEAALIPVEVVAEDRLSAAPAAVAASGGDLVPGALAD